MKRILLIDGDIVAYMFAAASEQNIDWGDGVVTCSANLDTAKLNVDEHITGLLEELGAQEYAVALSDPDVNFRKSIYPPYKSHRKDVRQPIIRRALEEYLVEKHHAKRKPGLEGDDVLGIIATNKKLYPGMEKIIVSDDKDMKTVPCNLYRQETDPETKVRAGKLYAISRVEADYHHLFQTLTGDPTDGYPGCKNVGPVKATALLTDREDKRDLWERIITAFQPQMPDGHKDKAEAYALVQARCARILRHEDYDYKRKEPILWHP